MIARSFFLVLGVFVAYAPFFLIGLAIGHYGGFDSSKYSTNVGAVGVFCTSIAISNTPALHLLAMVGYACALFSGIYY